MESFLRNNEMLANDFHIMDRKVSMGYWKRKSEYNSLGCEWHTFFLIFWRCVIFFDDISNQRTSQNILIKILKIHLQKNMWIEVNKNWS